MTNAQIAEVFSEMAALLELAGANPFRLRAYRRAAQTVSGLVKPLSDTTPEELLEIPGIGKGIATHIAELLTQGTFADIEALRKRFPKGLLHLIGAPGLGPKRAKLLFEKLKIASIDGLRAAAQAGRLRDLPGFGSKLEENILQGLAFAEEAAKRKDWWAAKLVMDELSAAMAGCPGLAELAPAGSLRRGKETVGDLDLLCAARDGGRAIEFFTRLPLVEDVLDAGETKARVWLKAGLQCDLRVVAPESFGAALQYFTGSKEHNVALRDLARRKGLTINEYGLFQAADARREKPLAGRNEADIYAKLGLAFIPPELRENRGEIEAARDKTLPALVTPEDIRGDFHNHTSHTDGQNSIEEMARAARARGWEWVAVGDHSRSLRVAGGLSVDHLRRTFMDLERVRDKVQDIRLMRSMEVDILKDGSLDYPDSILQDLDVVVASVHGSFRQTADEMTARLRKAAAHPHVDLLGHLSGRLLGRRDAYKVRAEDVLEAGARHGAAFEINGQPERQDLTDVHARRAKELGAGLAVTTDAHSTAQYAYMELAVLVARRAWLTKKDLLNCLSYEELREWLARPRPLLD